MTAPVVDDVALVRGVAAADRESLVALYDRHSGPLLTFATSLVGGDRHLGEEVLQDTFVALWRSAASFEGRSSVRTWLYGIAKRQAWNRTRSKRVAMELLDDVEPPAPAAGPEDVVIAGAEREAVLAAIARLAPLHREVLVLAFVDDLAYGEISQVLEVPVGTVKSRVSNAKRALAGLLAAGGSTR